MEQPMDNQIVEFCTITGASREIGASLLAACNGSLEMAINMHMEGVQLNSDEPPEASASQPGPSRKRKAEPSIVLDDDDDVRAPIPQKREVLVQSGYESYAIRAPTQTRGRVRSVFDGFRNFGNEARSLSDSGTGSRSKKRTLEELFKPPIDITFKGDFQSARDCATAAKKWLIVNIQDAGEFQCQILNRDVWSSEAVRTILSEHFLFWQQYKELEEAQRYMTFYPVTDWPHVAVLDPRTGERLVTWSKIPDAATLCDLISEFLTLHPTFSGDVESLPSQENTDEEVSIVDASEDDQIAAAIRASLADSTKKSARISDHEGCDSDNSSDLAFTTEDDDSNLSPVKQYSKPISPSVSNGHSITTSGRVECQKGNGTEKSNTEKESAVDWTEYLGDSSDPTSSIIIRFPDGKKEKKDIPCSSTFKAITQYVVSQGFELESFEIVTNFPRRVLSDLDNSQSLKALGLFPRETIFVQHKMTS